MMAGAINPDERRRSIRSSTSSRHHQSIQSESSSTKPKRKDSHSTPFDDKGRCHRHKGVQMATKKMSGGWKILTQVCPKCIEDNYTNHEDNDVHSLRSGKSASSGKSREYREKYDKDYSTLSSLARKLEKPYDANGCCVVHAHIQIAKKKVLGGWKVLRSCPACEGGEDIGLDDDRVSVASGKSGKSAKSNRSAKSGKGTATKSHTPTQSGRYGALPFDGEGYCCRHPSIRIAKKKTMGGWKILFEICPDCEEEGLGDGGRGGGARRNRSVSRSRRSSSVKGRKGEEGEEARSVTSGKNSAAAPPMDGSQSKGGGKKKVKNLKIRDESQCPGRYTGYVDEDYRPNGRGVITYENGMEWEGIWSGGSQVHGRMRGHKSNF